MRVASVSPVGFIVVGVRQLRSQSGPLEKLQENLLRQGVVPVPLSLGPVEHVHKQFPRARRIEVQDAGVGDSASRLLQEV